VPRLSIVIPCLGDAAEFDGTLVSVLQHRPADCEIFVVHRQPYDDPYQLDGEVHFLYCPGNSLVELINAAIPEASGEILHIIGCGLEATEGWTRAAVGHFNDPDVAAVTPIVMDNHRKQLVAAGVRWTLGGARREVVDARVLTAGSGRLRSQIIAPTLRAGFYRRDVLAALDGFERTMGDGLADVACGLALHALGRLTVLEPAAELILKQRAATVETGRIASAKAREQLFWRAAGHRGMARSLALHAIEVMADSLGIKNGSGISSCLGRAAAMADFAASRRHLRLLATAEERLAELAELRARRPRSRRALPVAGSENSLRKAA
jgi:hypothetical protein